MSKIEIYNTSLELLGVVDRVVTSKKSERINSDYTLDFQTFLTADVVSLISGDNVAYVDSDYFDIVYYKKSQTQDGRLYVDVQCEHVSYRLNDPEYDVEYFTEEGTPAYILSQILSGTGFSASTIDFTDVVTYSAQEKKSRRQLLMEFVAYLGGEVKFDQFEVSILTARGSSLPKSLTDGRNISVIDKTFNKREKDSVGNPLISYSCRLIKPTGISLGDVVTLSYEKLDIDISLRVVSITTNPYNSYETEFEIGNFVPGLQDDLYRIETQAVRKDALMNGTRIGPEFGFEAVRNDKKARAFFKSDGMAFQAGDGTGEVWEDKLYFDYDSETGEAILVFDGKLTAEAIEAISATIDVVISNTVIVNNLYAERGNIAELTVDQLDTSDKVAKYLVEDTSDVNYIKVYDQNIEFITASTDGLTTEQAEDRDGNPLYWLDGDHGATTTDVTDYPVMIYEFEELTKLKVFFSLENETYIPKIELGAGGAVPGYPDRGKGYIYKDTDGLLLKYLRSNGTEILLRLGEDGLVGSSSPLVDIDLYNDGMFTEYGDGTIYEWTFTKDGEGKITSIYNEDTDVTTDITWNAGDKP